MRKTIIAAAAATVAAGAIPLITTAPASAMVQCGPHGAAPDAAACEQLCRMIGQSPCVVGAPVGGPPQAPPAEPVQVPALPTLPPIAPPPAPARIGTPPPPASPPPDGIWPGHGEPAGCGQPGWTGGDSACPVIMSPQALSAEAWYAQNPAAMAAGTPPPESVITPR